MENNTDNFSEEPFLPGQDKKNSFVVPEGYFNMFLNRLLNRMEHEQELAEFKTLTSINRELKFTVPQNYFFTLENILEYKYELTKYTELNKIAKPILKPLPVDYFETLEKKVMDKIELADELKEFSVLSSLERKNNFKLTPDYFETSPHEVKDKIQSKREPTSVFLGQIISLVFKPKMAFAIAAVLIVGFTAVWYLNGNNGGITQSSDCKTLACLEKNELLNEKNIPDFDDENLYDMVDVDELDKKMSEETTTKDSLKINKDKK